MSNLIPFGTEKKEERLNKTNLKKIGFNLSDDYEDYEIGYSTYKHQEIEVTIEKKGWYCEINIGSETITARGVNSFSAIESLKSLMYGN